MGIIEWLKKDFKSDIERIKKHPTLFVVCVFFLVVGAILISWGWHFMHLPPPPSGYEYVTDYYSQGFISLLAGLMFEGGGLVILVIFYEMKD